MRILMIVKYPPIQGGVSIQNYWLAQAFVELGHNVCVLTNADEVEDEYRIVMNDEDKALLTGFRRKDSIRVISTWTDSREFFIPYSRPFSTKLISVGLELIDEFKPDFIYAHYVEPYGIAALHLSKLTNIPYVIKHAGSDLGKLGKLLQMKTVHERVYQDALFVATQPRHHPYFTGIGVQKENLVTLGFHPWAPDVFYATPVPVVQNEVRLLIYGKTGLSKGTPQLIEALNELRHEQFRIKLTAYWGGRKFAEHRDKLKEYGLISDETVTLQSYVPHWRIPGAIHASHAVLYLENDFSIPIHTPGIPLEVLMCGRPLVTTEEIANKYPGVITDNNAIIIRETPISVLGLKCALREVSTRLAYVETNKEHLILDPSEYYAQGVTNVEHFLGKVTACL